MAYVTAQQMEATWRAVGSKGQRAVESMQKRHAKAQKALCRYVYAHIAEGLPEHAGSVGVYAFHVVLEAFLRARPGLRAVRRPAIERVEASLPTAGQDYATLVADAPEPYAMQYVYDVLFEPEDDEAELSAHEQSRCWHVLHTAVLCLHSAKVG